MAYMGKKHKNCIWIPKSKTNLKEFRNILKLANEIESKEGYFNDKLLGISMVEAGGIFDGSLTSKEYLDKYESKKTQNQSHVASARMIIRMYRFFGWVSRDKEKQAKYYLTERGKQIIKFDGEFPCITNGMNEMEIMRNDIINMRYYCVHDTIKYQDKNFKQRPIFNILYMLDKFEYMHNYEIVCSAMSLKNESEEEYNNAIDRIEKLRNYEVNIAQCLEEIGINPNDKSSLKGVYDAPKVLCGFLKELNLIEGKSLKQEEHDYYEKVYTGSKHIKTVSNVFVITEYGKKILKAYSNIIPVWYYQLEEEGLGAKGAAYIVAKLGNIENVEKLFEGDDTLKEKILKYDNNMENINFDFYRDIPPEKYDKFIEELKIVDPCLKSIKSENLNNSITYYIPKEENEHYECIMCYPHRCINDIRYLDVNNSTDAHASKVCPVGAINKEEDNIVINDNLCTKCYLCVIACPANAIREENGKIKVCNIVDKSKYEEKKNHDWIIINSDIDSFFSSINNNKKHLIKDRVEIIKFFESSISPNKQSWNQVPFYTWVRNSLRTLGNLDVKYTGGPGMKTRSDVTIFSPFKVANEVKSPGESKVNPKAVRQAFDGSIELNYSYKIKDFTPACIGQEISADAIKKADEYKWVCEVNIPLITSKVLFYITLLNQEINFEEDEIELLFKEFHGEINEKALIEFIKTVNGMRIKKYNKELDIDTYKAEIEKIFEK